VAKYFAAASLSQTAVRASVNEAMGKVLGLFEANLGLLSSYGFFHRLLCVASGREPAWGCCFGIFGWSVSHPPFVSLSVFSFSLNARRKIAARNRFRVGQP